MIKIATFNKGIKKAIEEELSNLRDRFEVQLLDKTKGLLKMDSNDLMDIDLLVTKHLSIEEFKLLPQLKTLLVPMTGLDGVDEMILNNNKIEIFNVHSTAPYIAERGMAILMSLAGKIPIQNSNIKKGHWNREGVSGKWLTLRDKNIGIYGYGHIGKEFEKMIRPFSSNIFVIDRNKEYKENIKLVEDLDELTKVSDILFVAVPGNRQTKDTISELELKNLKGGLIVNVGRGLIVNQKALYKSLKNNELLGYGSDVWYNYPKDNDEYCLPTDVKLEDFEQVVMTPHNAWNHDQKQGLVINEMVTYVKQIIGD